jgi:hypothetical protein
MTRVAIGAARGIPHPGPANPITTGFSPVLATRLWTLPFGLCGRQHLQLVPGPVGECRGRKGGPAKKPADLLLRKLPSLPSGDEWKRQLWQGGASAPMAPQTPRRLTGAFYGVAATYQRRNERPLSDSPRVPGACPDKAATAASPPPPRWHSIDRSPPCPLQIRCQRGLTPGRLAQPL